MNAVSEVTRASEAVSAGLERFAETVSRVEKAKVFLSFAATGPRLPATRRRKKTGRKDPYALLGREVFAPWRLVVDEAEQNLQFLIVTFRNLDWTSAWSPGVIDYIGCAFETASEIVPAREPLLALWEHDKREAACGLADQLEGFSVQFATWSDLLAKSHLHRLSDRDRTGINNLDDVRREGDVERSSDREDDAAIISPEARFPAARDALLERAGGGLSLREAADALGVTRQALHKRIVKGTVLGMMRDREIVVPVIQLTGDEGSKKDVLPGVDHVARLFEEADAGPWSALQFLVEKDPNLGRAPIDALRAGEASKVATAARAYLGLDEG